MTAYQRCSSGLPPRVCEWHLNGESNRKFFIQKFCNKINWIGWNDAAIASGGLEDGSTLNPPLPMNRKASKQVEKKTCYPGWRQLAAEFVSQKEPSKLKCMILSWWYSVCVTECVPFERWQFITESSYLTANSIPFGAKKYPKNSFLWLWYIVSLMSTSSLLSACPRRRRVLQKRHTSPRVRPFIVWTAVSLR